MDSSNLAIIFAPTIFRPDMIDPMKAVMEMKHSKTILKVRLSGDVCRVFLCHLLFCFMFVTSFVYNRNIFHAIVMHNRN